MENNIPKPHGVRGGLLVFCIWLTILGPISAFARLHESTSDFEMFWGLLWIVLAVVTGILLWSGSTTGWKVANIYFWILFVVTWFEVSIAFYQINGIESAAASLAIEIARFVWSVFCLVYLNTSKRAFNTYLYDAENPPKNQNSWKLPFVLIFLIVPILAILVTELQGNITPQTKAIVQKHPAIDLNTSNNDFPARNTSTLIAEQDYQAYYEFVDSLEKSSPALNGMRPVIETAIKQLRETNYISQGVEEDKKAILIQVERLVRIDNPNFTLALSLQKQSSSIFNRTWETAQGYQFQGTILRYRRYGEGYIECYFREQKSGHENWIKLKDITGA